MTTKPDYPHVVSELCAAWGLVDLPGELKSLPTRKALEEQLLHADLRKLPGFISHLDAHKTEIVQDPACRINTAGSRTDTEKSAGWISRSIPESLNLQ